jgi:diguanylate cyclase (GGDEF)-like protein/PAS domain S-box-containing protein
VPDEWVVVDEVPVPLLALREGVVVAASAGAGEVLGMEPSELVGTRLVDLLDEATAAVLDAVFADVLAGRGDPTELIVATHSADPSVGRRVVGMTVSAGADGRLLAGLRELTNERRLTAVIDAVADSTLVLDRDGRLLWQSEALAARVPGGSANLGTHPVERLHPEDLPMVLEAFADLAGQPGGRLNRIVRSRAVDHDDIWQLIELVGASRVDDPELGGVVVQVRNLDVGSEVESTAQTDGPMLSMAEAAPVGILLMNRIERVMYASRAGRTLLGYGDSDDATDWRERVASGRRGEVDALVAAGLVGAAPTTLTIPFGPGDGGQTWLRIRVAPHLDARDQPVGVIVTLEDVTAEVEARTESERLLQMLDATSDYVTIFRASGEILHVNAALAQVLEAHRAAGGSGKLGELIEDRQSFVSRGLEEVSTSDTWHGELMLNVAPGEVIPVSALGVVGRDDEGEVDWVAMVARDISEQKEAEERLRRLATSDSLTGLANRALFTELLEEFVARAASTGRGLAVLFCDLDRFKEVNDEHGHAVGDRVLVEIADRLCAIIRGDDTVARVGGDEFVILCDGSSDPDALAALAERVIEAVHQPIAVDGDEVRVGISIGVAIAHQPVDQPAVSGDRILTLADQAMYRAKATGGNRYRVVEVTPA